MMYREGARPSGKALKLAILVVAAFSWTALWIPASASESCDAELAYPVGRCGTHFRETVDFCYVKIGARLVNATVDPAYVLGPHADVEHLRIRPLYLVNSSLEGVFDVHHETNDAPAGGFQPTVSTCGRFVWWIPEEGAHGWMGPYSMRSFPRDTPIREW